VRLNGREELQSLRSASFIGSADALIVAQGKNVFVFKVTSGELVEHHPFAGMSSSLFPYFCSKFIPSGRILTMTVSNGRF